MARNTHGLYGSQPTCRCLPAQILSYKNPSHFEYAGASGGYLDRNGYPYCRGRILPTARRTAGNTTLLQKYFGLGAALMVRTKAYLDAEDSIPTFQPTRRGD